MHVIGVFGYIGCGKDTVAACLESKYGYKNYSYGDLVRETSLRLGRTLERHDLQKTRLDCDSKHGKEYFPNMIVEHIVADNCKKAIISGIRNPEDAIVPKKHFGKEMLLIFVDVETKKRYERLKKRGSDRDPSSFSAFAQQEKREKQVFDFEGTKKLCDVTIKNNTSVKQLQKQIDKIMTKYNLV